MKGKHKLGNLDCTNSRRDVCSTVAEPFDFLTERETGEGANWILGTSGEPRRRSKIPMDRMTTLIRIRLTLSALFPLNNVVFPKMR